jgi:hypothetical protein
MKVFIVSAMLFACAIAAPGVYDNKVESDSSSNKMMQYFGNCMDSDDITTCLAVKGITALNRAARASNIQVAQGFVLAKWVSDDKINDKIKVLRKTFVRKKLRNCEKLL